MANENDEVLGARPAQRPDPAATAALSAEVDRLLGDQLQRVRRRWFVHGLATTLLLPAAIVLTAFLLDHFLRLPAPIRVFHTLVALAATGYAAFRFVAYPLSRRLLATDVAVLLERAFPELHERLVSTVQLKGALASGDVAALRNQSPAMIEQLLADTAIAVRSLPFDSLFEPRRTRRLWAGAATLLLVLGGGAIAMPATAIAFVLRHLGQDASYPRETDLVVELPPGGADLKREDEPGLSTLVVPAGADLHVSVLAEGVVPKEVFLDATNAGSVQRSIAMAPRPGGRFRYVFRRVTGNFEFHARGGDDENGDRRVVVRTIHPPLVAQIKVELEAPAYTQRGPIVQSGGAIEALIGTQARLSVQATAPVDGATLVFLESGKRMEMVAGEITDDAGTVPLWTAAFAVEQSDRYQIELVGEGGLRNPNPGTYPVTALQDYAPVGRWLQPDDEASTPLLPEGILCVRAEARDDFGLASANLLVDAGNDRTTTRPLLQPQEGNGTKPPLQALFLELLEMKDLLPQQGTTDGLALQLDFVDNKAPQASTTALPRRQVQVVDQSQLSASIARHFRSLREEVDQALDLQTDRKQRLDDLVASEPRPSAAVAQELTAIEVGQGRVQSSAERLVRGAMRAFDLHLWNRLESSPAAPAVVALYRDWHRENGEAISYQPAFYREVGRQRREGRIGAMEQTLDPVLQMVLLADRLDEQVCPPLLRQLAEAQVARDAQDLATRLRAAAALQEQSLAALQELRSRLDEWNDYQDLVQEARSLIEKQRDVQHRTEETRGRR